jgi:hypothetical protein
VHPRRCIAAAALVAVAASSTPVRAELPKRRLALFYGIRQNHGELGEDFPFDWQTLGAEAALLPLRFTDSLRSGPVWWVVISRFTRPGPGSVNPELSTAEIGLGWRLDYELPITWWPLMAHAQIGVELYRASNPVPPDATDGYVGFPAAIGVERKLGKSFFVGLNLWQTVPGAGPQSTSYLVTLGGGGY